MTAAAYARYSTDNQDANSIAYQLDKIQSFCREKEIPLCAFYTDEAQSGTNMDRAGFQNLVSAARRHEFDAVVIYDISRGSRDVGDWFAFRKEMMVLGIQIISATQQLGDLTDPNSFLQELISVGLGQHQVLDTRRKSIDGVAVKARQGAFLGGTAPLGYDIINGQYAINPIEATCVRTIFTMYAAGRSYNDILDAIPGAKGKKGKPLGKNSLHSILKNERYIGTYTWNKRHVKMMRKWAGGKPNPNCVRLEDHIEPIIDIETWERVQLRMKDNSKRAVNKAKHEYLLSGLIQCEKCGATYVGRASVNQKGYEYLSYACGNKVRTRSCDAKNIPANDIEVFVVAHVDNYLKTADYEAVAEEVARQFNSASPDLSDEQKELAQVETQINNGIKAVLSGLSIPELDQEIDRLRIRKSELDDIIQIAKANHRTVEPKQIADRMRDYAEKWKENRKAEVIKALVQKVYSNVDGTITVNIGVALTNGCGGGI